MLLYVSAFVLLGVASAQDCDTSQTDTCGQLVWPFLVDPTKAPANEVELEETCKILREGNTCMKDYLTRCPNVIKKSIGDSVVDSIVTTVEDFCNGGLGKRFLPHGSCVKENLAKNFSCNTDAVELLEKVAVFEPASDRLKHTCCIYLNVDKCIQGSTTASCDSRAARAIRNVVQSYAIFMVDKCLPFLSSPESCDLSIIKNSQLRSARRPKTFLPALVDVAVVAF